MKKFITVLLCILMLLTFVSCDNKETPNNEPEEKEIVLYRTNAFDCSFSSLPAVSDTDVFVEVFVDKELKRIPKRIEYNGKQYVGMYTGTRDDKMLNGIFTTYSCKTSDEHLYFEFDSSEKIISCVNMAPMGKAFSEKKLSEDEVRALAKSWLGELIEDAEDFAEIEYASHELGRDYASVSFVFTRKIGEFRTMEEIEITITEYGEREGFFMKHYGDMKNVAEDSLDRERIISSIREDLTARYAVIKEKFTLKSVNDSEALKKLVILKDGTVALDVTLDVLVEKNGTDETATETHRYIVSLE